MTRGFLFWILMILALVLGVFFNWGTGLHGFLTNSLGLYVVIALLGWQVFGPPIRG